MRESVYTSQSEFVKNEEHHHQAQVERVGRVIVEYALFGKYLSLSSAVMSGSCCA
jgi:hypothetical protein